jgi:RNA polymerase sigma factor (sigma-70 family)
VKRDHGVRVTLDDAVSDAGGEPLDVIALDDALRELEALSPRQGRVVELRYFAGLSIEQIADALAISAATVKRDWTFARAFLLQSLSADA